MGFMFYFRVVCEYVLRCVVVILDFDVRKNSRFWEGKWKTIYIASRLMIHCFDLNN